MTRDSSYHWSGHASFQARAVPYLLAILAVIATVGIAFLVSSVMPHASLALLFLTSVVIVAAYAGLGPSLLSSVLGFLALNYLFTTPHYTFEVADDGDVATLVFFLVTAAITGNLAARMRREMEKRRTSLAAISNLYDFSRRLSSALGTGEILDALAGHLAAFLQRPVVVLMEETGKPPEIRSIAGGGTMPPATDIRRIWPVLADEILYSNHWNYIRIQANQAAKGAVAVFGDRLADEASRQAKNLCDQASVAIDRTLLVEDLEQTRLVSETEQLRSALLSSVSHDLRTPLASIIGSTTSLLEYGDSFSDTDRKDLLSTVVEEAQRLDRHIQNLLDMTRLGQGSLTLRRDWVDLNDIISSAEERMRDALRGLAVHHEIQQGIPLLWVHGVLIEQALVNLLDNAIRFSPSGGVITVSASCMGDSVVIDVCDEGPGVPEQERNRIFDMFYTIRDADRRDLQGTGLGLAICRGMVMAHGGTVAALDGRDGKGACMRIVLPVTQPDGAEPA